MPPKRQRAVTTVPAVPYNTRKTHIPRIPPTPPDGEPYPNNNPTGGYKPTAAARSVEQMRTRAAAAAEQWVQTPVDTPVDTVARLNRAQQDQDIQGVVDQVVADATKCSDKQIAHDAARQSQLLAQQQNRGRGRGRG